MTAALSKFISACRVSEAASLNPMKPCFVDAHLAQPSSCLYSMLYVWSLDACFLLSYATALYCCLQVWYGVPGSAADAFETVVQDCLPHLTAADGQLLHKAMTAVSPNQLRARGLPVCR